MTFTDDDLNRLKAEIPEATWGFDSMDFTTDQLEALIARLEASESALIQLINFYEGKDPLILHLISEWKRRRR